MKTTPRILMALAALLLVISACGGDDDGGETDTTAGGTDTTAAPTETTAATGTTAAATGTTSGGEAAAGSLLIWADELRVESLEAIAPAFTEATGVEVVVELVPFGEIRDQVTQAGPAGEGPDIFVGAHDWTGELAANGVIDADRPRRQRRGVPADRGERLPVRGLELRGALRDRGDRPLLQHRPGARGAGHLRRDRRGCEAAGPPNCVVLPGGGATPDAYHNYPFVSAYGGSIFAYDEATGNYDPSVVRLDTPEAIQGGDSWPRAVADGVVGSTDYDTAKNLFLEGSAPFWITGPWELGTPPRSDDSQLGRRRDPADRRSPRPSRSWAPRASSSRRSPRTAAGAVVPARLRRHRRGHAGALRRRPAGHSLARRWRTALSADPQVQTFAEAVADGIPMPNVPEMGCGVGPARRQHAVGSQRRGRPARRP